MALTQLWTRELFLISLISLWFGLKKGNTEEELEEYTEIFENIEEYRGDSKKNKPIDDDDDSDVCQFKLSLVLGSSKISFHSISFKWMI